MNRQHETFERHAVIGILRGFSDCDLEGIVPAACAGGLRHLEITMNSPDAPGLIRKAIAMAGDRDKLEIGAGTVLNPQELDSAIGAGARFIVTPVVNEKVIRRCLEAGIPVFPGAFTPTEIVRAWDLGATMVKIFPADHLGIPFIKTMKGEFPHIRLLPTGGVTRESVSHWMAAGADGFGVGSPLFDKERVRAGDWKWVEDQCRAFVTKASFR